VLLHQRDDTLGPPTALRLSPRRRGQPGAPGRAPQRSRAATRPCPVWTPRRSHRQRRARRVALICPEPPVVSRRLQLAHRHSVVVGSQCR
jgi:hypothetical protein